MEKKAEDPVEINRMEKKTVKEDHFFQVDVMKMLMMVLVIVDHSFTHDFMHQFYSPLWERIAIPLFMIIMGFNLGKSFQRKELEGTISLKKLYSARYFISKIKRYILPYIVIYSVMTMLYYVIGGLNVATISNYPYDAIQNTWLGIPIWWGPGSWYIPVVFTSILIFPVLYKCFSRFPGLTLIGTFIIEIFFHIVSYVLYYRGYGWNWLPSKNFFTYHILFLFSAVGMGLWFSRGYKLFSIRNLFVWLLLPVSFIYLFVYSVEDLSLANAAVNMSWLSGDYHFVTFPYSAFLFLIGMNILPRNLENKLGKFIRYISKATYHILLCQIFYFSIAYNSYFNIFSGIISPINDLWIDFLLVLVVVVSFLLLSRQIYRIVKNKVRFDNVNILRHALLTVFVPLGIMIIIYCVIFFLVYPNLNNSASNLVFLFFINLIITFSGGILWKQIENRFYTKLETDLNLNYLKIGLLVTGFFAFIARFISQFLLFSFNPIPLIYSFWDNLAAFFGPGFSIYLLYFLIVLIFNNVLLLTMKFLKEFLKRTR